MTKRISWGKRCIIGENLGMPNEIKYLPNLSNHPNHWVGYCVGDSTHTEHLIIIKYDTKNNIIYKKSSSFRHNHEINFSRRLFKKTRQRKFRCPDGKCFMYRQKAQSDRANNDAVDILKCLGHRIQKGHESHFVRVEHGILNTPIHGKQVGVLVVYIEKKQ